MRAQCLLVVLALAAVLAQSLAAGVPGLGRVAAQESVRPVEQPSAAPAGRTPMPSIARGKGDACVAPTDWMRRFHMTALEHKRDDTVHDGIRTPRFGLQGCIACHAVPGADGKPVTIKDERHFCRSCHDYAAVKVDCFECHASRPDDLNKGADAGAHGSAASDERARLRTSLGSYLEGRP